MSKVWVILEVKGNPTVAQGGNYYYSMHGAKDKQIVVRDTDIVQVVELSSRDRSAAWYKKELAYGDRLLHKLRTEGADSARIDRALDRQQTLFNAQMSAVDDEKRVETERWEYGLVANDGSVNPVDSRELADVMHAMGREVTKRPVGDWVDYTPGV